VLAIKSFWKLQSHTSYMLPSMVRAVKSQKLFRAEHITQLQESKNEQRILMGIPLGKQ
jgi:hypothetical protein